MKFSVGRWFGKSGGMIASLVVVAAVLPVILIGALSEDLRLRTLADQNPVLRIWIEPEEVVTAPGRSFSLRVYADSGTAEILIPQISFDLGMSNGVEVQPHRVEFMQPFSGRAKLGDMNVVANEAGEFEVTIPDLGVDTTLANVQIVTRGTKIISQE